MRTYTNRPWLSERGILCVEIVLCDFFVECLGTDVSQYRLIRVNSPCEKCFFFFFWSVIICPSNTSSGGSLEGFFFAVMDLWCVWANHQSVQKECAFLY